MNLRFISYAVAFFCCINVFAQNTFVFFGSYNKDKAAEGIYVYELDTLNGNLTKVASVKDVFNPSFITLSPNGKYVYACTDTRLPEGTVSSYAFDSKSKTLNFVSIQKSGGVNPVFLATDKTGKWLVNANYSDGSVAVFPLLDNGVIEPFVQNYKYTEGSINPNRQESSHVHAVVFSPDFDYVFFPDLGSDGIRTYQFESNNEEPLQSAEVPFLQTTLGGGPRHLTFHPNKKNAYLIEELSGTITVFDYQNGKFTEKQRIATHPKHIKEGFQSSDVHVSPDGKFLYASNRGEENNIAVFLISENGKLTNIDYTPTGGDHPRVFGLDESGKFLIVTNSISGNVFVFMRNEKTGKLTKVGNEVKINSVSCVKIKRYTN